MTTTKTGPNEASVRASHSVNTPAPDRFIITILIVTSTSVVLPILPLARARSTTLDSSAHARRTLHPNSTLTTNASSFSHTSFTDSHDARAPAGTAYVPRTMRRAGKLARDALTRARAVSSACASTTSASPAQTHHELAALRGFQRDPTWTPRSGSASFYSTKAERAANRRPILRGEDLNAIRVEPVTADMAKRGSLTPTDGTLYGEPPETWEERERATLDLDAMEATGTGTTAMDEIDALLEEFLQSGKIEGSPLPSLEEIMAVGRSTGEEDEDEEEEEEEEDEAGGVRRRKGDETPVRVPIRDSAGRSYGTGKRKTAIARVWLTPGGTGEHKVNGRPYDEYFSTPASRAVMVAPFFVSDTLGAFTATVDVHGGGVSGQAQAVRHGVSVALQNYDPAFRPALKAAGFLTRDSRIVERKKPGKAKARKSFAWVKR